MFPSIRRSLLLAASLAGWVAAPAMASSAYHPQSNEAGASFHPEHVAERSREQVSAELAAAMKHPAWNTSVSRGAPWPSTGGGAPKTRAQVRAELDAAMRSPAWSLASRGAPWPSSGSAVNEMTPK